MQMLHSLNQKQQDAVRTTKGPLLILAGAGSGKTTTLAYRIAYLIYKEKVSPDHILAVTFTNKAAKEMNQRVRYLIEKIANQPNYSGAVPMMGTFHSVCVRILRKEAESLGYKPTFSIYDTQDQLSIIKDAMHQLSISQDKFNPRQLHGMISSAKNELITPRVFAQQAEEFIQEVAARVYERYQELLKQANAFDFDDLIMKTVELFEQQPEILKRYQEQFQYVLVDEYQDTNHAQYRLIHLLAQAHRNLCVVGDDWQSIYGWRGAQVKNILNFEKDYPDATIVLLEENYRSTQTILDVAHQIISKNENQKKKKLWTSNGTGNKVTIAELVDEKGEALYLADKIRKMQQNDRSVKLNDIVVLYRTNAQSRALEEIFLQRNIPYRIVGGLKFYERKEIKDMLAYLRLLYSFDDFVSFERIINEPKRGIGDTTIQKLRVFAYEKALSLVDACVQISEMKGLQSARVKALQDFGLMMKNAHNQLTQVGLTDIIDLLIRGSGYKDYIKDGTEEGETRWENIQELLSVASKFNGMMATEGLREFLEEVALITDLDTIDEKTDAVTLMTLHAAKGLEFSCVFMTGLEEGLLPHSRALADNAELEEERRLCYVGLTRAKKQLFLTYTMSRTIYGRPAGSIMSRFVEDIQRDASHLVDKEDLSFGSPSGSAGVDSFLRRSGLGGGSHGNGRPKTRPHGDFQLVEEDSQIDESDDEPEAQGILGKIIQRKKKHGSRAQSRSDFSDGGFAQDDVIDADEWSNS